METRVAVIGTIMENKDSAESVSGLFHQYSQCTVGGMRLPYVRKKVNITSVVVDAPQSIISALSGKLGRLQGINSEAPYSNIGGR